MTNQDNYTGLEIAVIGMSGRFPESPNLHELWTNLKEGKEMVSFFTDEELLAQGIPREVVNDPNYIKAKGFLSDAECFDAPFFGYTNREADYMDPQFRIFHECAYNALEDAGYADSKYRGVTGLFAGAGFNPFWMANFLPSFENFADIFEITSLNAREYMTTRVAYKLDLNGPTMTLQTACSTSLVAVHMACQSLLAGEADMALAGGVSILFPSMDLPRKYGMHYQEGMIISKDGHCKPFDNEANGFMGGDGVGIVVLKRLEDAIADGDNIYAVVKGSAINNDGSAKAGYTAPGTRGQTSVIETALQLADVAPESISYVETHGSGTKLGDPIEMQALTNAYSSPNGNNCGIGSVKSNFGHLDAAAGIAGFIKTVLSLKNAQIPASINFNEPNSDIDFENSPFYVNNMLQDWEANGSPRRAAVSSFGIGGTNAHLIMEEAPVTTGQYTDDKEHLILLSAKTKNSLFRNAEDLKKHLEANPATNLKDLAYTLQVGRRTFDYKRAITCKNVEELVTQLAPEQMEKKVKHHVDSGSSSMVMVFSGLGGQYVNMGFDLYQKIPAFKTLMDEGFQAVTSVCNVDLMSVIYPALSGNGTTQNDINRFDLAQLSLFILERALAKLLIDWGVKPVAVAGYSFGELTAAHVAGIMNLEDTLKLIVRRGDLILQCESGAMLSVPLPKDELVDLPANLSLAIDNGETCVLSGPEKDIDRFAEKKREERIICMKLSADRAIHSPMMAEIAEPLKDVLTEIQMNMPAIPMVSNVTGTWADERITQPDYWIDHLSGTVEFAGTIKTLLSLPDALMMEIGPGIDITSTIQKFLEEDSNHYALNSIRPEASKVTDLKYFMMRLQMLWQRGVDIDWTKLYEGEEPKRISLPGYKFEKHRYWFKDREDKSAGKQLSGTANSAQSDELYKNPDQSQWYYTPSWQQGRKVGGAVAFTAISRWLVFSDGTDFSNQLIEDLRCHNQEVIVLKQGVSYTKVSGHEYIMNPMIESQYQFLLQDLTDSALIPDKILHLWNTVPATIADIDDQQIERSIANGFNSLTNFAREMHENDLDEHKLEIFSVSRELFPVIGNESLKPVQATILGAIRVLPIEFRNITCRLIDVAGDDISVSGQVLSELTVRSKDQVVAFRNKYRWTQHFEHFSPDYEANDFTESIQSGKVYVIVGGLCSRSNLGFVLAKHLSETADVQIVFVSRTEYPGRTQWDEIATDKQNRLASKIEQIRQIEKGKGKVHTYSADLTDPEQLTEAFSAIENDLGEVNGVINVAGIMDEQAMGLVINNNSNAHFKTQFDIKVKGTINLYRTLKNKKLDFCILSSSLTSVMGPFSAYCAGNNFMDSLVHMINQEDDKPWLTINWDHLLGFNDLQEDQPLAITHEEILSVFERLLPLSKSTSQVIISSANIKKRIARTLNIKEGKSQSPVAGRKPLTKWFYQNTWQPVSLAKEAVVKENVAVVFTKSSRLNDIVSDLLKEHSEKTITVAIGDKFSVEGNQYTIEPGDPEHYIELFNSLAEIAHNQLTVYHLWNCEDKTLEVDENNIWDSQEVGLYSLQNIAKAVANISFNQIDLRVLTSNMHLVNGNETVLCPEKASLLGAVKIIPVENQKITCSSFDVDSKEILNASDEELSTLAASLLHTRTEKGKDVSLRAFRSDQWYSQEIVPIQRGLEASENEVFRKNGTYLLTGGLGGMALQIVEHIGRNYQANFILIDTREMPPRKEWKNLRNEQTDEALIVRQLQNIECFGSRFQIISGDISDYDALKQPVSEAINAFGEIDGVFHIAGAIDHAGIMQSRSIEDTQTLIAPKLQGALTIAKILEDHTPDFEVYFSSTGNIFSRLKFGQLGYNAGHEFLDVFAQSRRLLGKNAFVFNSNDWHGIGIAAEAAKTHSYSLKNYDVSFEDLLSINPREGIYSLISMLQNEQTQVVVSAYDVKKLQNFINELDFSEVIAGEGEGETKDSGRSRAELSSEYVAPKTETEKQLAGVFMEIFRIEEVGIDDDFFELGGDSIKAISAISLLQQNHNLDMPVTTFFEKRTIRNLSKYLSGNESPEEVTTKTEEASVSEDFYEPFPVSPIQMAYIMGRSDQFDMGGISTNIYQESKIDVDLDDLNKAFNKLLNRHAMLKIFFLENGQQQFHKVEEYEIRNTDLRGMDAVSQQNLIKQQRDKLSNHLFDEKQWPLFDITTYTLAEGEHYLFFCFDHLICDAASLMILVNEWGKLVKDVNRDLPELEYTYRDYIIDFEKQRNSPKFDASKKYWLDQLYSFPSAPAIPLKTDPSKVEKPSFKRNRKVFNETDWKKLKHIARENGCTPSVVLCAAYARVLSFWSNSDQLAINLTLFNRYPFHKDVQSVIGDFTLLVLLGIDFEEKGNLLSDIRVVQKTLLEALDNRFYDGIDFIKELRKTRKLGTSAVMPYVFTSALFETGQSDDNDHKMLGVWDEQREEGMAISQTSQVFIDCTIAELNGNLEIVWDHVEELFEKEVIDAMFGQFIHIIESFIEQKNDIDLQISSKDEEIIAKANAKSEAGYPEELTIVDLFEQQVEATPGNIAISYENESLTYEKLNSEVNQLAHHLRSKGLQQGQLVALMLDEGFGKIVGILAVLKAGGGYLPIDPNLPADRINYMLTDSEAEIILLSQHTAENENLRLPDLQVAMEDSDIDSQSVKNPEPVNNSSDLAYVIYTSGTTGFPKGAMIEHRNVVRLLFNDENLFDFNSNDVWTMFHSYSFDFSVWEMYGALLNGGELVLVSRDTARDTGAFSELLNKKKVTILNQTPSAFVQLSNIAGERGDDYSGIRKVIFGGERLMPKITEQWLSKYPDTKMINMYGITETTVHVTYKEITEADFDSTFSNIGVPIPTTSVKVLDTDLKPCPVGVTGEMYVGGEGVCRGYLNRDELTNERFIIDPSDSKRKLYRSGDLARWNRDGELEYMGRGDQQVKIKGFRIELPEIENHLMKIDGITGAVVVVKSDRHDHQFLCAYVVAKNEMEPRIIRQKLFEWLPDYMVPAKFQFIEAIPLTSNGKVNVALLPEPEQQEGGPDYNAPETKLESDLVGIFAEVLDISSPGINDSFFDLGGDSFKATFLITKIQKDLGVKITLAQIFNAPTVSQLAVLLEADGLLDENDQTLQSIESYPLSSAQKRLFVQHEQNRNEANLNTFVSLKLSGPLAPEELKEALKAVVKKHDSFRTYFQLKEGRPVQSVAPYTGDKVRFDFEDMVGVSDMEQAVKLQEDELASCNFDLYQPGLYRLRLLRVAPEEHILLFAVHNIIFDSPSLEVFLRELFSHLDSSSNDEETVSMEPDFSYKNYVERQKQLLKAEETNRHQAYWLEKLNGTLPVLQMATDSPRTEFQEYPTGVLNFEIPDDLVQQIEKFISDNQVGHFAYLTAALKALLFKYSGQNDIIVGTPVNDREGHSDMDRIGCYVNTVPIRDQFESDHSFIDLVRSVERSVKGAFEHQAYPLDKIIEIVDPSGEKGRHPLFDVLIDLSESLELGDFGQNSAKEIEVKTLKDEFNNNRVDLSFKFIRHSGQMRGSVRYNLSLFEAERIERLIQHLLILQNAAISEPDIPLGRLEYQTAEEIAKERQKADFFSASIDSDF